ncbi:nucleotidyltransferase domain-containing protein [Microlunatus flavus]|uniref:nucleotidyltransferase domain-containing protein n=1 Tax=Microlunatus flavus TaxID=1036181 RepID=UPI0038CBF99A
MFTEEEREALRTRLIGFAREDARVVAAASLGSAARGELDRWSDVDLALRLAPGVEVDEVVEAWTELVAQSDPVVLAACPAPRRRFPCRCALRRVPAQSRRRRSGRARSVALSRSDGMVVRVAPALGPRARSVVAGVVDAAVGP